MDADLVINDLAGLLNGEVGYRQRTIKALMLIVGETEPFTITGWPPHIYDYELEAVVAICAGIAELIEKRLRLSIPCSHWPLNSEDTEFDVVMSLPDAVGQRIDPDRLFELTKHFVGLLRALLGVDTRDQQSQLNTIGEACSLSAFAHPALTFAQLLADPDHRGRIIAASFETRRVSAWQGLAARLLALYTGETFNMCSSVVHGLWYNRSAAPLKSVGGRLTRDQMLRDMVAHFRAREQQFTAVR